jgi:hypothetical protein
MEMDDNNDNDSGKEEEVNNNNNNDNELETAAAEATIAKDNNDINNNKKKNKKATKASTTTYSDNLNSTGKLGDHYRTVYTSLRQGVDRLLIASKYRPLPILKQALSLLAPSAPFVVYYEYLEPLIDCYLYLQQTELAIKLTVCDTWLREYQILPGRFRPEMFMSGTGGYLLTGIYVGMPYPYNIRSSQEEARIAIHQQFREAKNLRHEQRGKRKYQGSSSSSSSQQQNIVSETGATTTTADGEGGGNNSSKDDHNTKRSKRSVANNK